MKKTKAKKTNPFIELNRLMDVGVFGMMNLQKQNAETKPAHPKPINITPGAPTKYY